MRIRFATLEDGPQLMPFARQAFIDTYVGHPASTACPVSRQNYIRDAFTLEHYAKEFKEEGVMFLICEEDVPITHASSSSTSDENAAAASSSASTTTVVLGYAKIGYDHRDDGLKITTNPKTGADYKVARLYRLYVGKEHIGKRGIGKAMLKECEGLAIQKGYDFMWLGVWEPNTPAVDFYKKHGYAITGELFFVMDGRKSVNGIMSRPLDV